MGIEEQGGHLVRGCKALLCGLFLVTGSVLTLQSAGQTPLSGQGQGDMQALATSAAEGVASQARRWVGHLSEVEQERFRRWLLVVRAWKKTQPRSASPLLAEGVLFDCIGHFVNLNTGFPHGLAADPRFNDLGLPERRKYAAGILDAALRWSPDLAEAQFRAADIRAASDASARVALERLALTSTEGEIAYLSAISRAAVSLERGERSAAAVWYERALATRGHSTAAVVGLALARPGQPWRADALDEGDVFYTYPCRVMTAEVRTELARRIGEDGR